MRSRKMLLGLVSLSLAIVTGTPAHAEPEIASDDTTVAEIHALSEAYVGQQFPPIDVALFTLGDEALITRDAVATLVAGGRVEGLELLARYLRPQPEKRVRDMTGWPDGTTNNSVNMTVTFDRFGISVTLNCVWCEETKRWDCTPTKVVWP